MKLITHLQGESNKQHQVYNALYTSIKRPLTREGTGTSDKQLPQGMNSSGKYGGKTKDIYNARLWMRPKGKMTDNRSNPFGSFCVPSNISNEAETLPFRLQQQDFSRRHPPRIYTRFPIPVLIVM